MSIKSYIILSENNFLRIDSVKWFTASIGAARGQEFRLSSLFVMFRSLESGEAEGEQVWITYLNWEAISSALGAKLNFGKFNYFWKCFKYSNERLGWNNGKIVLLFCDIKCNLQLRLGWHAVIKSKTSIVLLLKTFYNCLWIHHLGSDLSVFCAKIIRFLYVRHKISFKYFLSLKKDSGVQLISVELPLHDTEKSS